ncbi:lysozyme 1B [Drosophila tropicalis]|uniref:lysozyme 1B n=1 Tax=Drosophila tropicalis TaxID=46794 RepID=UPI0035AB8C32
MDDTIAGKKLRVIYKLLLFLLVILQMAFYPLARRLERCDLAGQLYILDVVKEELPLWLCIADFESRLNTHVIGTRNDDGSKDYGLFQISDRYWCAPPNETEYYTFNQCNLNCTDLLKDDITKAVQCAQLIKSLQGWSAWSVYAEFCNNTELEAIDMCFQSNATIDLNSDDCTTNSSIGMPQTIHNEGD